MVSGRIPAVVLVAGGVSAGGASGLGSLRDRVSTRNPGYPVIHSGLARSGGVNREGCRHYFRLWVKVPGE